MVRLDGAQVAAESFRLFKSALNFGIHHEPTIECIVIGADWMLCWKRARQRVAGLKWKTAREKPYLAVNRARPTSR